MTTEELKHIDEAAAAHVRWLARLRAAIVDGASELSPAVVRRDDQCEFGKWLYGPFPPGIRESPVYEDVRRTHAQFHIQAAAILHLALAGHRAEAEKMIDPRSEFVAVSGSLLMRLRALRGG